MKKIFTMVSVVKFEVDGDRISEVNNSQEAFEKGVATISEHKLTLTNPDGTRHENPYDIMLIKQSIEKGLKSGDI